MAINQEEYANYVAARSAWMYVQVYLNSWLHKPVSRRGMARSEVVALLSHAQQIEELASKQLVGFDDKGDVAPME